MGKLRLVVAGLLLASCRTDLDAGPPQRTTAVAEPAVIQRIRGACPPPSAGAARPLVAIAAPDTADGDTRLEDAVSKTRVDVRLIGASATPATTVDEWRVYTHAYAGADVVHRTSREGLEDYVVFETKPAREELRWAVDVSHVAGLRLFSNTLELLDARGIPALRVTSPYVVDAAGQPHDALLSVDDCRADANATAPYDGHVTPPGATRCTVRVAWSEVSYPAIVDPAWTSASVLPGYRVNHTATLLASGRILVAGGLGDFGEANNTSVIFDPAANGGVGAFITGPTLKKNRQGHTATLLPNGRVLLAGGSGKPVSSMPGGEIYDPAGAGSFSLPTTDMFGRTSFTATALPSGKVLIAGGYNAATTSSTQIFDPATNAFSNGPSMTRTRRNHAAALLVGGKVLITGGADLGIGKLAEVFDPATFPVMVGQMNEARANHNMITLPSGKVLVSAGSTEIFDPATNQFSAGPPMMQPRGGHTTNLLASGLVLVAGGRGASTLGSVELFDPLASAGAGAFSLTAPLATSREGHTTVLLATGRAIAIGGSNPEGYVLQPEIYGGVLGDSCTTAGYCHSGKCVDGVCCNTACGGSCDRCDLPGSKGTCTIVAAGDPGAGPACAFPLACDGTNVGCPASCASDAACAPGYFCAPDATCQLQKSLAATCNVETDCKVPGCRVCSTGSCVDGVCCDTACTGTCLACTKALKQEGEDGTCGPVREGLDPHDECSADPTAPCAGDGVCSGTLGGCRNKTPQGATCGESFCDSDKLTARGLLCDGNGTCKDNASGVSCAPFVCADGGCTTACVTSADCASGAYCDAGICKAAGSEGAPCTAAEQCLKKQCVDGVCCNSPCDGQCEACDGAGTAGTCTPIVGAPHGARPACSAGDAPCTAAFCDGVERGSCVGLPGANVSCGTASCTAGVAQPIGACSGTGACRVPASVPCGAYACGADACKTSCADDADCSESSFCDRSSGRCAAGATCDGDHTIKKADGTRVDCAPYRCESTGACRLRCGSVADCAGAALCDPSGACVLAPAGTDEGGCATGGRSSSSATAVLFGAFVLVITRRRRPEHSRRRS